MQHSPQRYEAIAKAASQAAQERSLKGETIDWRNVEVRKALKARVRASMAWLHVRQPDGCVLSCSFDFEPLLISAEISLYGEHAQRRKRISAPPGASVEVVVTPDLDEVGLAAHLLERFETALQKIQRAYPRYPHWAQVHVRLRTEAEHRRILRAWSHPVEQPLTPHQQSAVRRRRAR